MALPKRSAQSARRAITAHWGHQLPLSASLVNIRHPVQPNVKSAHQVIIVKLLSVIPLSVRRASIRYRAQKNVKSAQRVSPASCITRCRTCVLGVPTHPLVKIIALSAPEAAIVCQAHQRLLFVRAVPIAMKEHQLSISAQPAPTVPKAHGIRSSAMRVRTLLQVLKPVLSARPVSTVLQGQMHLWPAT